jgi:lipoprotein-releasing system permease protein
MYKIKLAIRYILGRRISWLAVAAVALCVFMVVVVMTVLSGLVTSFKEKNHRFTGDCIVSTPSLVGFPYYQEFMGKLEQAGFVGASTSVITNWALLSTGGASGGGAAQAGCEIMGIDPNRHCQVTDFGEYIYYHRGDCASMFKPGRDPNRPGIILGIDTGINKELIGGRSGLGDYVHFTTPPRLEIAVSCFPLSTKGALAKMGTGAVNTKMFTYSDDCHSGLADADTDMIYVPFDDLQSLCGMDSGQKRTSAIYIKLKPGVSLSSANTQIAAMWNDFAKGYAAGPYADLLKTVRIQTWKEYARDRVAPLEKEETMMTALFCLVGVITVFIIFVIFYMIVNNKTKDIGILKSVGADNGDVLTLFLNVAAIIGLAGSAIGVAGGIAFLTNINRIEAVLYARFGFQLWDRSMYAIEAIPNRLEPSMIAIIVISAVAACLLGALLPAVQASRNEPARILQVNQL